MPLFGLIIAICCTAVKYGTVALDEAAPASDAALAMLVVIVLLGVSLVRVVAASPWRHPSSRCSDEATERGACVGEYGPHQAPAAAVPWQLECETASATTAPWQLEIETAAATPVLGELAFETAKASSLSGRFAYLPAKMFFVFS